MGILSILFSFLISFHVFAKTEVYVAEELIEDLFPLQSAAQKVKITEGCKKQGNHNKKKTVCSSKLNFIYSPDRIEITLDTIEKMGLKDSPSIKEKYLLAKQFLETSKRMNECSNRDNRQKENSERMINNLSDVYDKRACHKDDNKKLLELLDGKSDHPFDMESEFISESMVDSIIAYKNYGEEQNDHKDLVKKICEQYFSKVVSVNDTARKRKRSTREILCSEAQREKLLTSFEKQDDKIYHEEQFRFSVKEFIDGINKEILAFNNELRQLNENYKRVKNKNKIEQVKYSREKSRLITKKNKLINEFKGKYLQESSKKGRELLLTDTFQEAIQVKKGKGETLKEIPMTEDETFIKAKKEASDKIFEQLKYLVQQRHELNNDMLKMAFDDDNDHILERRKENLHRLYKTNPMAVARVFDNNPKWNNKLCMLASELEDIKEDNEFRDKVFFVAGAGIAVAGVLTGFGIGPGVAFIAALGASATLTVTEGRYHLDRKEDSHLTRQIAIAQALSHGGDYESASDINSLLNQYESSDFSSKLIFGLGALDVLGIKQAIRIGSLSYASRKIGGLGDGIQGYNKFLNKVSTNPDYTKAIKDLTENFPKNTVSELISKVVKLTPKEQDVFLKHLSQARKKGKVDLDKLILALSKYPDEDIKDLNTYLINNLFLVDTKFDLPSFPKEYVYNNAELAPDERIAEFEALVATTFNLKDFKLSDAQVKAVLEAHEMDGEVFNLTFSQTKERLNHLKEVGLNKQIIKLGMDAGILGKADKLVVLQSKADRVGQYLTKDPGKLNTFDIDQNKVGELADFRSIFLTAHPQEFNALWKFVSKKDMKKIKKALDNDEIVLDPIQKERFLTFYKFMEDDKYDVLWKNTDGDAHGALQTRYPLFRGASSDNWVGGNDTYTLDAYEGEMVRAAAGIDKANRVPMGSKIQQWIDTPFDEVKRVVEFNNIIREQLTYVDELSEAIDIYMRKANEYDFKPAEMKRMKQIKEQIKLIRADARGDVTKAYGGQNIFHGGIDVNSGGNPYEISKVLEDLELLSTKNTDQYVRKAEELIDELDDVLNARRRRLGLALRETRDFTNTGLKVRNKQFQRTSSNSRKIENNDYAKDSDETFRVRIRYEESYQVPVTKTRTVTDGNGKTRTVTETVMETRWRWTSTSRTIQPSYSDIIDNDLYDYRVGASTSAPAGGRNASISSVGPNYHTILDESSEVRAIEGNLRSTIRNSYNNTLSRLENHADVLAARQANPQGYVDFMSEVSTEIRTLEAKAEELRSYADKSDEQVRQTWDGDDPADFKKRTASMAKSYEETAKLLRIHQEQIERMEYDLVITANTPDYTVEFNKMKYKQYANWAQKAGVGAAGLGGLTVAGCKVLVETGKISSYGMCGDIRDWYEEKKEQIKELTK